MSFRSKLYTTITIIIVACCLLLFLAVAPLFRGILEESDNFFQKRKELASIELLAQSFEDFEDNYYFYAQELEVMRWLLMQEVYIDPELPINFINFFKEQAEELGLSLKILPGSAKSRESKENDLWQEAAFRVEGTGNFQDIMRFLERLENSRWLVEITNLNLTEHSPRQEREAPPQADLVHLNVSMRVLWPNLTE